MYLVLVERAGREAGDENLPDARDPELAHLVKPPVPVVEAAHDAHAVGVRSPHGERDAALAPEVAHVRAKLLVAPPVASLVKEVLVEAAERREKGVGVARSVDVAVAVRDAQQVRERLLAAFDKNATAGRASLVKAKDADFQLPWTLKAAGNAISTQPRYMVLRQMVLHHLVHHRAQLGPYRRLTEQKVPQIYGPTADER